MGILTKWLKKSSRTSTCGNRPLFRANFKNFWCTAVPSLDCRKGIWPLQEQWKTVKQGRAPLKYRLPRNHHEGSCGVFLSKRLWRLCSWRALGCCRCVGSPAFPYPRARPAKHAAPPPLKRKARGWFCCCYSASSSISSWASVLVILASTSANFSTAEMALQVSDSSLQLSVQYFAWSAESLWRTLSITVLDVVAVSTAWGVWWSLPGLQVSITSYARLSLESGDGC